ncbi:MAG: hypothetical protein LBT79_03620 [Elusimicrobiota bacterium]|jgi:hypothetical protein|nr:hypothetical protein [Elusimicrobiota bacterium]
MSGENLIYDYALKVNLISNVAGADTGFLRVPLVVVKPAEDFEDVDKVLVATKATIASITDNPNIVAVFNGGCPKILVIATEDLAGIKEIYKNSLNDFYTLLISRDFTDEEIDALNLGDFKSVLFSSSADSVFAGLQAKKKLKGVYYQDESNFFYAWGKFLSAIDWNNLQFQELLNDDGILDAPEAENLFNDRVSFSLKDSQSVNRLAFFAQGGEAIIAPYVMKEIELMLQSQTVNWININKPQYDEADCSLLAQYLKAKVIDSYISRRLISGGEIEITTEGNENFIASGTITIPKPTALWRVAANLYNA